MRSPQQNFLSHKTLGIKKKDRGALISVLGRLERNEVHAFDMSDWAHCIYGQCKRDGAFEGHWEGNMKPNSLYELFCGSITHGNKNVTQSMAAQALRNYLVNGRAEWATVSAD